MKNMILRLAIFFLIGLLAAGGYKYYQKVKKEKEHAEWVANLVHTASPNVEILKDIVEIDYLGEKRTVSIYLPEGYETDTLHYPVIYFLDGQSLFDEKILENHEWQIDEVLDSLAAIGGPQAIIIGLYNTENRSTEYKPFLSPHLPEEKEVSGDKLAEWMATDLKQWVDEKYRTKAETSSTIIGGASLGGLMAYYMLTTYPDIYGGGIVFSPSFWVNDKVFDLHKQVNDFSDKRIFMNAGEIEKPTVEAAQKVYDILIATGMPAANLKFDVEKDEGHWHITWRKGFKKAFPWILEE